MFFCEKFNDHRQEYLLFFIYQETRFISYGMKHDVIN